MLHRSSLPVVPFMLSLPPLSLYIHLPWCVSRCPYCDFNAYALKDGLPEEAYVEALLADLELELPRIWQRPVVSVFLGGGTPSLFSGASIARLLDGVRARVTLAPEAEISMEANPGSVEHDRFEAYHQAGVNRISLGVQSFADDKLKRLGRIHSAAEARAAINAIRQAGFERFNIDLMWALPEQTLDQAVEDVRTALSFNPRHVSHYQLTLEPNTVFAKYPPPLPDEDSAIAMQEACAELLTSAGLHNYEISAWATPGQECVHNLNYWRFGDYIGIGAGAHGKITLPAEGHVLRTRRKAQPQVYLKAMENRSFIAEAWPIAQDALAFEYFLNCWRLNEPIALAEFEARTGLDRSTLAQPLNRALELELIELDETAGLLSKSERGSRFVNDLQALFL